MPHASSGKKARESASPPRSGPSPFSDALCAIDGTPESLAAVEQAAAMAGPAGQLTLLTATAFRFGGANRSPAIGPGRAKEITDMAVKLAREAGVSSVVEVDPDGAPPAVILGWADGRDLLALGAPPTSLIGSRFVRGVADAALGSFTTPMLVARPRPAGSFGRRILVASDGRKSSDHLVALAGRLATAIGAEVGVVHVAGSRSTARVRRVHEQAKLLGSAEPLITSGHARGAIAETAAAQDASLVIMGSHRPRGLAVLGSVSAWFVHEGPCSVLVMPAERLKSA